MRKIFLTLIIMLVIGVSPAMGANVAGVELPDSYTVNEERLILNGTALRKKLVFKVYAGGFYFPHKVSDVESVYEPDTCKAIRMHFIYKSVTGKKIQDGYIRVYKKDGFDYKNSVTAQQFLNIFSFDIKKDDIIDLVFEGNGKLKVKYNNKVIGTVTSEELCLATLKVYFGKNAIKALKTGFLGR
mmetsp:Transcript_20244/g.9376  ORF Transcript_20244/g.9376 Transcript_20244/m.9376 type:complete len:185 (-) Transcript_20244:511-1065(-)